MVSPGTQRKVWKHYRKGQEIDKRPSKEYLAVMKEAIREVAQQEEKLKPAKELPLFEPRKEENG